MSINWKKVFGFGIVIWAIMFAVTSALVGYGMSSTSTTFNIVVIVISLVVVYLFARNLAPESYGMALQYGLCFAIVGILLDYAIMIKFVPDLFSSTIYWVSYVLVALVPMATVKKINSLN